MASAEKHVLAQLGPHNSSSPPCSRAVLDAGSVIMRVTTGWQHRHLLRLPWRQSVFQKPAFRDANARLRGPDVLPDAWNQSVSDLAGVFDVPWQVPGKYLFFVQDAHDKDGYKNREQQQRPP